MGLGLDDQCSGISGGFAGHATIKVSKRKRCTCNGKSPRHLSVAERYSHSMMTVIEHEHEPKRSPHNVNMTMELINTLILEEKISLLAGENLCKCLLTQ